MAGRRRWAEFPGEVPTAGLYAAFGAYLYCVSRILFLGFVHREAPEVFLTPVVLGRGLQFWISAGNLLWARMRCSSFSPSPASSSSRSGCPWCSR